MPFETLATLSSVCSMIVDCPHSTPVWTDSGHVVIRNQNIKQGRLDLSGKSFTDTEHFRQRIRRAQPHFPDLIITREAPMGEVCMVPSGLECCLGQRQVLLRPDSLKVNPRFLLYAIQSTGVQKQIAWNEGTGSTVSNIRIPVLESLKIPLPPLSIQEEVAEMMGALDDKIALLRETNATLEAIAQALFKSWFVDFDPVRAKAEGRDPEGVPPEVAALFPSEFTESELGAFPKGWSWGTLEHYSELNPESWSNKSHPESLLYVDLANAKENQIDSVAEFAFEDAPSRARRVLRHGDTIIGTVRPGNKSFALIQNPSAGLTGSTGFAVLRPRKGYFAELIFLAATRKESIECLANLADGGAYPAVRPEVVQQIVSISCPNQIAQSFHELVLPLFKRLATNNLEAGSLADLRDTLLPRLMSGKLHVNGCKGLSV